MRLRLLLFCVITVAFINTSLFAQCPVGANVNFFADTVTVGSPTTFTDSTTNFIAGLDSMSWDVNNDSIIDFTTTGNQTFVYPAAGTYTCVLTVFDTLGCSTSVIKSVLVNPALSACASGSVNFFADTVTVGTPTTFIDSTTNFVLGLDSMRWDMNNDSIIDFTTNGNQTFTYPAAGTYTCVLTVFDTLGCSVSITKSVLVNPAASGCAVADFFADTVCLGTSTTFIDATAGFTAGSDSITWDMDNDGIVDFTSPGNKTFTYPAAGTYTCVVTVFDTSGCLSAISKSVIVNAIPSANFSITGSAACQNTAVQFNNTSSAGAGVTYQWDFENDGVIDDSTSLNPTHSFTQSGTITVQLIVTSAGCTNSTTNNITISANNLMVNAGVDKSVVCGNSVSLTAASNQTGVSYNWSPASSIANPFVASISASPTDTTDYIVTASKNGCSDKDTVRVFVVPMTVTAGNDKTITCGSSVQITATSNNNSGAIYTWSPATGLNNTGISNPTATPNTNMVYTVVAIKGTCVASDTVNVSISGLSANAGPDKTITCGTGSLLSALSVSGATYSWSPVTALSNTTIINPNANPLQTTTYTFTVNKGGCTASDSVVVNVVPFQISAGNDKNIVCGNTVVLSVTSSVSGGTYNWSPSTTLSNPFIASPIASPVVTTPYAVTVTKGGCVSRDTVIVNVDQDIPISFTSSSNYYTGYPPYTVQFTNQTTNSNNYTYSWDFGDGTFSSLKSPSHQYFNFGAYSVQLVAYAINGNCSDTLLKSDYIFFFDPNGIQLINAEDVISVFPNPASESVMVEVNTSLFKNNYTLRLFNSMGEEVRVINSRQGSTATRVAVSDLAKGIYFISISDKDNRVTKRLIIN